MPTYSVQTPEGKTLTFNGNSNTPPTEQEIDAAYAQSKAGESTSSAPSSGYQPIANDNPETPFQPSPASPSQRMNIQFANTPEGRLRIAQHMGLDATLRDDGKLLMKNQATGEYYPVTPDAKGFTNFLKDISGRMAEFIPQSFPAFGQIAGDAAGTIVSGGNPVAGITAGTFGAGLAEAGKEKIANQLGAGEEMNPGEIGMQAGTALAGGALGEYALKPVIQGAGKVIGSLLRRFGSHAPEVIQTIGEVPEKYTLHVMEQVKNGRALSDVINERKADPSYLIGKTNQFLFGNEKADRNVLNMVRTYQRNASLSRPGNVIDSMYQNEFGLSPSTLEAMKNYNASDILSKSNTDPEAIRTFAKDVSSLMDRTATEVQNRFGAVKSDILAQKGDYNIPTSQHVQDALKGLADRGLLTTDGKGNYFMNDQYPGSKQAQKLYSNFLSRIATLEKGSANDLLSRISSDLPANLPKPSENMTAKQFQKMIQDEEGMIRPSINLTKIANNIPTVKAAKLNSILNEFGTSLDSFFGSKSISDKEAAPMAKMISGLRDELAKGIDDPRWTANNEMYKSFKQGSAVFGKVGDGSAESEINAVKNIRDAYANKDEQVKRIYADYISKLDQHIPKDEAILPRLNKLGAGQELSKIDMNDMATSFENKLTSINPTNPRSVEAENALRTYDDAVPKSMKFLNDTKDSLASKAFMKPGSLWKTRSLAFILGGLLGAPGGIGGKIATLGAGSILAQPENLIKIMTSIQKAGNATNAGMSSQGSLVLRQLVSNAMRNKS